MVFSLCVLGKPLEYLSDPYKRTPEKCLFSGVLAHLRGFEPLTYRLGVTSKLGCRVTSCTR